MSQIIALLKQIENLNNNQLAEALEYNGYLECVGAIRKKNIDGEEFLKLTELQISLWRLPPAHARRLWSFIQQIKNDPSHFSMNTAKITSKSSQPIFIFNNKPLISEKPQSISNKFQKTSQIKEKDEISQTENTEANFSTLSKEKSKELKNKLELVFKNETPNSSFIHSQKQPKLPPKPAHLRSDQIENAEQNKHDEESPDDFNDGYLSPINKRRSDTISKENEQKSNFTRSNSFLHKFRKGYENLEIRPEVVENKYEEQNLKKATIQERPLPPVPQITRNFNTYVPSADIEIEDEELADYTPVLEDEIQPIIRNETKLNNVLRKDSFNRPLPKSEAHNEILKSSQNMSNQNNINEVDDEEIPEYTSVVEEEEETKPVSAPIPKLYTPHRPLPPIPTPSPPLPAERGTLPKSIEEMKFSNEVSQKGVGRPPIIYKAQKDPVHLKPRIGLPSSPTPSLKSSNSLPKPPIYLPRPPDLLLPPQDDLLVGTDFDDIPNQTQFQQRPSPIPPTINSGNFQDLPEECDDDFYTEIDLATLPSYRETDRKGARRLLSGLVDGAFLIRPSRQPEYVCTLSIMTTMKMFNLGIEKKSDGTFTFGSVGDEFQQPRLYSVGEIISFYSKTPLYLSGEYIILKDMLPRNKR